MNMKFARGGYDKMQNFKQHAPSFHMKNNGCNKKQKTDLSESEKYS